MAAEEQQQRTMERRSEDPLGRTFEGFNLVEADSGKKIPQVFAPSAHQNQVEFIIAQRVPVERDTRKILNRLAVLASAAGDKWVYGWDVNDRKAGRKVHVEGPTIKLANDLWREYGNAVVDTRVIDEGAYWMIYARFADLQTGANMTRAFQQRKSQGTGMEDDGRRLDMLLQLGQSKAIRNVIVNALQTFADYCVEEAKKNLLGKVVANPDGARGWILEQLEDMGVDRKRVEGIYGRSSANWTAPDMAKIYREIRGVRDNMILADEVWPEESVVNEPSKGQAPKTPAKKTEDPKAPKDTKESAPPGPQQSAPPAEAPPAGAPPVAVAPVGTVHFFDAAGKSHGSLTANPTMKVGAFVELGPDKFKIISLAQENADNWKAIVHPATPAAPAEEHHQSPGSANPETGAGQQRAQRKRGAGGKKFGDD